MVVLGTPIFSPNQEQTPKTRPSTNCLNLFIVQIYINSLLATALYFVNFAIPEEGCLLDFSNKFPPQMFQIFKRINIIPWYSILT